MEYNENNIPGPFGDPQTQNRIQQDFNQFANQAQQGFDQFANQAQQGFNQYANQAQQGYDPYAAPAQQPAYDPYAAPVQQPAYDPYAAPVQQPVYDPYAAPVQQGYQQPAAEQPKKKKTGLIIGIIAGVLALLGGLAALYFLVLGGGKVKSIELSETALILDREATKTITAKILPEKAAEKAEIKWSSSDTSVARVDDKGNITAVGGGTCTITAEADNKKEEIKVTVNKTNAQERKILGTWYAVAGKTGTSEMFPITGRDWPLTVKDDLTMDTVLSGEVHTYNYVYNRTDDDGRIWFKVRLPDSGLDFADLVLIDDTLYFMYSSDSVGVFGK
ncbi:MAG: Ig-like domain-containing protein [Clostridia bacterium]|nr:Ig-like domain-containing protein [Clostridia bacterium]